MKKVSFTCMVVGTFFVLFNSSLANDPPIDNKGKLGISLSVSGLNDLRIGLYQGGIGVKHWCSNSFVLKSILGLGISSSTRQNSNPDYTDEETDEGSFSLNLGAEFHFSQDSKFSPYFYTGFNFTTTTTTTYYTIPKLNPPPGRLKKRHISSNSFGLDEAIGLEYFLSKHFSLAAEYQVGLSFQTEKEKTILVSGPGVTQRREVKSSNTTFGAKTSSLLFTVYF